MPDFDMYDLRLGTKCKSYADMINDPGQLYIAEIKMAQCVVGTDGKIWSNVGKKVLP